MSDSQKNRTMLACWVIGAVLVAMIITIVVGEPRTISDQKGGDWFRNIIFDFQTLITGVLAVGAAYFTIIQTRAIDDRAQERHEQLFELNVRPDKLRLARAYTHFVRLRTHGLILFSTALPKPSIDAGFDPVEGSQIARSEQMCLAMIAEMKMSEFVSIRDLFDGELHSQFDELETRLHRAQIHLKALNAADGEPLDTKVAFGIKQKLAMTPDMRGAIRDVTLSHLLEARGSFDHFRASFEVLARQYKVL